MNQAVHRLIKRHNLLFRGAKVTVGVSGGPDSLALLQFLWKYREYWDLSLIAAHANHGLRGIESKEDYHFVKSFCKRRGIKFVGANLDVKTYQEKEGVSIQVAARDCRYRFFEQVLADSGSHILALGHHGDDQVETMLMRQVRGAYGEGLSGIPVKRPFNNAQIIRPLLAVSKDEILKYCQVEGLTPRIDKSNFSSKYTRNRFRAAILPLLKNENPTVHLRFQQQSEFMKEDEQFLQRVAQKQIEEAILHKEQKMIVVSVKKFKQLPIPLQRRGFHLILKYLYGQTFPTISTIHIEQFMDLVNSSHSSGQLHFPNKLVINKSYDKCIIKFWETNDYPGYNLDLPIPGIVNLKKGKIIAEVLKEYPEKVLDHQMIIDLSKVKKPLCVRTRKQGDRINIIGMNGSKKVKDIFINEKIARYDRDVWPLVIDSENKVLWIPRIRRSALASPSEKTEKFLLLSFVHDEEK